MNPWELHPLIVHFPIALLLSATALDVVAAWRQRSDLAWAAAGLLVVGELSAIVAAVAGFLAYFTVPTHSEEAHLRMIIHPILAGAAVLLFGALAIPRWKRRKNVPGKASLVLSLAAASLLIAAGGLGGYLVFHDGVGVAPREAAGDHTHRHAH